MSDELVVSTKYLSDNFREIPHNISFHRVRVIPHST